MAILLPAGVTYLPLGITVLPLLSILVNSLPAGAVIIHNASSCASFCRLQAASKTSSRNWLMVFIIFYFRLVLFGLKLLNKIPETIKMVL